MKINVKHVLAATLFIGIALPTLSQASSIIQAVSQLDLQRYLGEWHEIVRKPLKFQKDCAYNITANYSLNEQGNVKVNNRCYKTNGEMKQSLAEGFVQNPPTNSKLKVSFLPKGIRWIPVGRGDYWVLKIDENYQHALVGTPDRKYLWLLSRDKQPSQTIVNEYLNYAKNIGYDLSDVIQTPRK